MADPAQQPATGESNPLFTLDPSLPNATEIVAGIQGKVLKNVREGGYDDARIARAERSNLATIESDDEYLRFYLRCLHNGAQVDITDFEISDQRSGIAGKGLVKLKTTIWKMLKFYTYRMWSQQNDINSYMASALETTFTRHEETIAKLEQRIADLEAQLAEREK